MGLFDEDAMEIVAKGSSKSTYNSVEELLVSEGK